LPLLAGRSEGRRSLAAGNVEALVANRPDEQRWLEQMFEALVARDNVQLLALETGKPARQIAVLMLAYVVEDKNRTAARLLRTAGLGSYLSWLGAFCAAG
jgi:hypothetical protein